MAMNDTETVSRPGTAAAAALSITAEFEFRAGPHEAGELVVLEMQIDEELSRPYSISLTLVAREGVDVDPDTLLGEEALVIVHLPDSERYFHGVVAAIDRWDTGDDGPDRNRYVMRVVPRLWTLGQRRSCRIFQALSAPEIVKKVLEEGQVSFQSSLSGSYPARKYCVQYRESDLEFVSRLLEEEGIFYYFEHTDSDHVMTMIDSGSSSPELPGGNPQIPFREPSARSADEHVDGFFHHRLVRPTAVALRDYDFLRPSADLQAVASSGGDALEIYDYPGRYYDQGRGKALSKVRLEELRVRSETGSGSSTSRRLAPGCVFELTEHPVDEFNGEYMLLSVHHRGSQPEVLSHGHVGSSGSERPRYRNEFVCLHKDVPFRPERRTQPPLIPGPQTAVVVGPAGEEIYTDENGRIKVQFHWDREGTKNEHSSCWVRVSQAWAGPAWGALYIPRIGHEVVVEFLEGDPDRPVVTGSVYNGLNPPPIALPGDKTKSTLRSSSSPGGDGSNELRFEDAAGSEEIYLHAQKDLDILIEHDKAQHVGHDETLTVDVDRSRSVGGNQSLTVEKDDTSQIMQNQSLSVGGNRTVSVAGNHTETVAGDQSVSVGANASLTVGMASLETVALGKSLNVGGVYAVTVGGAMNEAVGGLKSELVGGAKTETIAGKKTETVAGNRTQRVGGDLSEVVDKSRSLKVGQSLVVSVTGALQHSAGKSYQLKSKEITISAEDDFTLKVGQATISVKKSGDVVIQGSNVQVTASGALTLKGSAISEN